MPHAVNQHLALQVVDTVEDAIAAGYDYSNWPVKPVGLRIERVVIVRHGTVEKNSTVDLILVDDQGNKYVTMVTGNLLKMLPL